MLGFRSNIDVARSAVFEWGIKYIPHVITVMYGAPPSTDNLTGINCYHGNKNSLWWPHTWTDDMSTSRCPLLILEVVHSSVTSSVTTSSWYGVYGGSILFWVELVIAEIFVCLAVSLPIAILMYFIIIVPQKRVPDNNSQKSDTNAKRISGTTNLFGFIFGWGVLLPSWIILPSPIVTACGIDNIILRFCLCGINPTIAIFRTLEAMYGFAPSHSTTSVYQYALYFTSPLLLMHPRTGTKSIDKTKYRQSVWFTAFREQLVLFVSGLCRTGMLQSVMQQFYMYGTGPTSTPSNLYRWSSVLDVHLWYQSFAYAILMQSYLTTFIAGLSTVTTVLTGCTTQPFSDAPLQSCTSPSNFWGRRWNLLIHTCLKNGVYKPIRSQGGPILLAVTATFIASGLFHEWLLLSVMPDYPHTHGLTMTFFLWQGMLVAMEIMIGTHIVRWFSVILRHAPSRFITVMVILMGLPVGHWFLDSYVRSDFFKHGQFGLPMILSIPVPTTDTKSSIPTLFKLYLQGSR